MKKYTNKNHPIVLAVEEWEINNPHLMPEWKIPFLIPANEAAQEMYDYILAFHPDCTVDELERLKNILINWYPTIAKYHI